MSQIIGEPPFVPFRDLDPETRDELKSVWAQPTGERAKQAHVYVCPVCGQSVDKRSLYQAMYHDEPEHEPISDAVLTEIELTRPHQS